MKKSLEMPTRDTNRIVVNLGGEQRTIVVGMRAFQMVSQRMKDDTISLTNASEVMMNMVALGMRNKPEDLDEDTLVEWIDDMDYQERELLQKFINTSLGFIISDYANSVEQILPQLNGEV